jgi:hypothetical protein
VGPAAPSLIDSHRVLISAGLGLARLNPLPYRIDLWGQLHHLLPRDHPMAGAETVQSRGRIIVGGLSLGMDFE